MKSILYFCKKKMDFLVEMGYPALFIASFLAATITPFSSEAALTGIILAGYDPVISLLTATLGNWLGGLSSYYLGYLGKYEWIEKYLRIPHRKTEKFKHTIAGKETWIALFAWLPVIGDLIAVVLGLTKAPFWHVCIGMLIGKLARFSVWGYITVKGLELLQ